MTPDLPHTGVAAGVVLFHPDAATLLRLLDTVAPEVDLVFVFLNSPLTPDLRRRLSERRQLRLIGHETNLGVGVALNRIMVAAGEAGLQAAILFDQDSQPPPGMVGRLVALDRRLRAAGQCPAVVAPRMVSAPDDTSKPPTYRVRAAPALDHEAQAVDFVPTSGSLIGLDAWRAVGAFREDYFIDGIDLEWSFRAWSRGFSCWIARECRMAHSIGAGVISWPLVRFRMPAQKPFRMHCLVRNTLYGLRLKHVPLGWRLKQGAYLPIQVLAYWTHHGFDAAVLRLLLSGVVAGWTGRLGVPPGLPPQGEALPRTRP